MGHDENRRDCDLAAGEHPCETNFAKEKPSKRAIVSSQSHSETRQKKNTVESKKGSKDL